MKLLSILVLCVYLAYAQNTQQNEPFRNKATRMMQQNVTQEPVLYMNMTLGGGPCSNMTQRAPLEISKLTTMHKWQKIREVPLTDWNCVWYKMQTERGFPSEQIHQTMQLTQIWTWIKVYDRELNSDIDIISVNSIIACCFWVATGAPTFIALILLFVGGDLKDSKENYQQQQTDRSQKNPKQIVSKAQPQQNIISPEKPYYSQ